jgi:hypothetical protein
MSTRASIVSFVTTLALIGCAEDLSDALGDGSEGADDDSNDDDAGGGAGGPQVDHDVEGDTVITTVDATDGAAWIHLDLETRSQVTVADPLESDAWDLAFQRYDIATNGGVSGPGGMTVAIVDGTDLASVTAAPGGPWLADAADGDDTNDDPDYAMSGWYDYDVTTHVLTPKPVVHVVRTPEGNTFAIQVLDYYDAAGSSGWMQLRWRPLSG